MKSSQFHYPSFFGFMFFAVCAMFLFLISGILGLSALITSMSETQIDVPAIILFVTVGFSGSLLAAAAVISIMKFTNSPTVEVESSTSVSSLKIVVGIFATGLVLWIGNSIQSNSSINWFALPLLTIPAVGHSHLAVYSSGNKRPSSGFALAHMEYVWFEHVAYAFPIVYSGNHCHCFSLRHFYFLCCGKP